MRGENNGAIISVVRESLPERSAAQWVNARCALVNQDNFGIN